jgi:hypothetical protein
MDQSGFDISPDTEIVTASDKAWDEVIRVSNQMLLLLESANKILLENLQVALLSCS